MTSEVCEQMSIILNVILNRKKEAYRTDPVAIDKAVIISNEEYKDFVSNLLEDCDIIKDNKGCMAYRDGITHCLLILSESESDGILVYSSGYDYARYTAYLTNAKELIKNDHDIVIEKLNDVIEDNSPKEGGLILE